MALISIVVPVYFNAPSLPSLAIQLAEMAQVNRNHEFEFIFVDDGSNDNSFDVLQKMARDDHRIRVLKLSRNFGSNIAILAGLSYANGDCAGVIAADLQDPPEKLTEMISSWETGNKVVLAVRKNRYGDPWTTRIFSNIFNALFKQLVYKNFSPQGVGFFLIDRKVVNLVIDCCEKNTHLIGLILWTGFEYGIVEYDRAERIHGKSRWTFSKKIKYLIDAFTSFSYLPLRLSSAIGLSLAGLAGIYGIVIILMRILNKVPVAGWTTLTLVILLVSGIQLVMLGVIGEYLWRNFDATRKRPTFVIEKAINLVEDTEGH